MCVLCVQVIARDQEELQDPSISEEWRALLESDVQHWESYIQRYKAMASSIEEAIQGHLANLERQGEPRRVAMPTLSACTQCCHVNSCQAKVLP